MGPVTFCRIRIRIQSLLIRTRDQIRPARQKTCVFLALVKYLKAKRSCCSLFCGRVRIWIRFDIKTRPIHNSGSDKEGVTMRWRFSDRLMLLHTNYARSRHSKHKLVWCQLTKPPHHGVHPVASLPTGSALPAWLVLVECRQPKHQSQWKSYRKFISADTGTGIGPWIPRTFLHEKVPVHILGRHTFLSLGSVS